MNAVILAAGTSSRFVPHSIEKPKGLIEVKGEILVERQIRQLQEAGIFDIIMVVGYKFEQFKFLKEKYGVRLVYNEDYYRYNNISSLMRVIDDLNETYICSSDNYFPENVFLPPKKDSFYSALYSEGPTEEYCLITDEKDFIVDVTIGGKDSWYMVGHVYFNNEFSSVFRNVMQKEYERDETRMGYWEDLYIRYIDQLPPLKVNRYKSHAIEEFDSLDDLRQFDKSYIDNTRSSLIKLICSRHGWKESYLSNFKRYDSQLHSDAFLFNAGEERLLYDGGILTRIDTE